MYSFQQSHQKTETMQQIARKRQKTLWFQKRVAIPQFTGCRRKKSDGEWFSQALNGRFLPFALISYVSPQNRFTFHPIYQQHSRQLQGRTYEHGNQSDEQRTPNGEGRKYSSNRISNRISLVIAVFRELLALPLIPFFPAPLQPSLPLVLMHDPFGL